MVPEGFRVPNGFQGASGAFQGASRILQCISDSLRRYQGVPGAFLGTSSAFQEASGPFGGF